jgi:outer membrane protein assembly factor BamA
MKRTDQDGLLIGPGLTFTNILGEGIHQELLNRFTAVPEPFRAKEFLSYTYIPEMNGLPFTTEVTINYFQSYNALKLYDEKSLYSQLCILYRLTKMIKLEASGTSLWVKHDSDSPVFTSENRSISMFQGEGEWDYLPSLGAGIIIDTRNRLMNPHSGCYNELKASIYGEKLGGDSDYAEYIYDFRGYLPVSDKHIIHANFLTRYRPGTIPGYELYHIGGINSLRTYEPDPSICGQHEMLWTVEYRYELFANRQISLFDLHAYYGLQLVLGMDNTVFWFPGEDFRQGTYLNSFFAGIHLLVPILERVRLEFGLHGPYRDENEIRFGINFGWYEKTYTQRRRVR